MFCLLPIVMRTLGPEQYGQWILLAPMLTYSVLLSLGVPNAMNRLVPILNGRGMSQSVREIQAVTLFAMMGAILMLVLVIGVAGIWGVGNQFRSIIPAFVVLLIAHNFHQYVQIRSRAEGLFEVVSRSTVVQAVTYPVCALFGVFFGGLHGFILGQALALLIAGAVIQRLANARIEILCNWRLLRQLVAEGIPIAMLSLAGGAMDVVGRYLIGLRLGQTSVGYYGLSVFATSAVLIIPTILAQLFYPKIAFEYGRGSGPRFYELFRANQRWNLISLLLVPLVVVATLWLMTGYLASYQPGFPAMCINILAAIITAAGMPHSDVLLVRGQYLVSFLIIATALLINFGLSWLSLDYGNGMEGVAWSAVVASTCMTSLLFISTRKLLVALKDSD